jgi:hypothetical protein
LRRYFTTQFKASWDHAMAQPEDVLDGDSVTGSQALKSIKLQAAHIKSQTPDSAVVVAQLTVTPLGDKPYPQSVTFAVKRDGSVWKIDDISGPVEGSLRGYFRKSYGQRLAAPCRECDGYVGQEGRVSVADDVEDEAERGLRSVDKVAQRECGEYECPIALFLLRPHQCSERRIRCIRTRPHVRAWCLPVC